MVYAYEMIYAYEEEVDAVSSVPQDEIYSPLAGTGSSGVLWSHGMGLHQ